MSFRTLFAALIAIAAVSLGPFFVRANQAEEPAGPWRLLEPGLELGVFPSPQASPGRSPTSWPSAGATEAGRGR